MKIKHFMYLLALVLMINLNACSSDSPEEEIPEVPPQEEPGTDPNVPQGADIVVSPNTLLLKDGLDKYVDNPVEGSTLSLNTGVQASELPEVGRVLLYGGISDKFPLGFLGKVSKVEKTATGYDIETEPASLEETFDKLYVNDTLDIELDDTALAQSRAIKSHKDAEGYTGLQTRFEFPLGKDLNGIEGWEVGDLSASLEGRVIYGVGLAMKLHCFMDMDKAKGKKPHIEFGFFLKTESGLDATLEGSLGIAPSTYSKDLWDILIKPAVLAGGVGQVVSLIVTPHFTGKLFTEINGEVDFAAEAHHKDKWEIKYVYKDGKSELLPPTHQNIREDPFKPTSVKLKGKYSAGMAAAVEVRLFNIKEASCGVQMKAGPAIRGQHHLRGQGRHRPHLLQTEGLLACLHTPQCERKSVGEGSSVYKRSGFRRVDGTVQPGTVQHGCLPENRVLPVPRLRAVGALPPQGRHLRGIHGQPADAVPI